jgi:RNA polymerase sigma-70 factor (ECF subfamily)
MSGTAHRTGVAASRLDRESAAWLGRLQPDSPGYRTAVEDLRMLLLKAARFEVRRRGPASPAGDPELEDLAQQSADDALLAVLRKLGDFRGESRFTTWAYKFALLEAAVKVRRRAWQGREVKIDEAAWTRLATPAQSVGDELETAELLAAIAEAVPRCLTAHQREVLTALALDGVPVDVLAERLDTTRGALYKTLHDARRRLRAELEKKGLLR